MVSFLPQSNDLQKGELKYTEIRTFALPYDKNIKLCGRLIKNSQNLNLQVLDLFCFVLF